jgi:hypothetical protein
MSRHQARDEADGEDIPPRPAIRFWRLVEGLPDLITADSSHQDLEKEFAKESLEMVATIANNNPSSNLKPPLIPSARMAQ